MKARKRLVTALVALNLVLVAALLSQGGWLATALGQVRGGGADYLMVVGEVSTDLQALWVIDLASGEATGADEGRTQVVRSRVVDGEVHLLL